MFLSFVKSSIFDIFVNRNGIAIPQSKNPNLEHLTALNLQANYKALFKLFITLDKKIYLWIERLNLSNNQSLLR